ncbi:Dihydrolipoyllysine-residue succinyltransferase component of 2-oxoglutarate dehydrogenase complex [compost metagenome]
MNTMALNTDSVDINAPEQTEGTKAVLRTWLKADGDRVVTNEPVAELETDKVVVEVCAPCDGVLSIVMPVDTDAPPGVLLGRVTSAPAATSAASPTQSTGESKTIPGSAEGMRLSPAVRRLVVEQDLKPA